MARTRARPRPNRALTLAPLTPDCPVCQHPLWAAHDNYRTATTLDAVLRLTLRIRRCPNPDCPRFLLPFRPEAEAHLALPHHEFGLDVLTLVGRLRHAEHRSVPEIHGELIRRGVVLAQRSVSNLLDRYDELRALTAADPQRLRSLLLPQGRVVLALDGLQPDVGHEVLWVLRDCLSGEVLLTRSLLSAPVKDLSALLAEVQEALPVPITGVISDAQNSIRKAVAKTLPGVPHQLCHFHYLRDAAKPIYEADRHAKKELKKRVRGIRAVERQAEGEDAAEAEIVRGYCAAVRSALTDDGRPPLAAAGLKLHDRLEQIAASLERVAGKVGKLPGGLKKLQALLHKGLQETAALWPAVRAGYKWVKRAARLLENPSGLSAKALRRRFVQLLSRMRQEARVADPEVAGALRQFVKVSKSHWKGLFACYQNQEIPRTNNDLEQLFGAHRYHERRASGRKVASPGLVVQGSVRVLAGLATRLRPEEGWQLPVGYVARWQQLRSELDKRRQTRRQQRRFRQDPSNYLKKLEELANQLSPEVVSRGSG